MIPEVGKLSNFRLDYKRANSFGIDGSWNSVQPHCPQSGVIAWIQIRMGLAVLPAALRRCGAWAFRGTEKRARSWGPPLIGDHEPPLDYYRREP
jgi:hypothetical protein